MNTANLDSSPCRNCRSLKSTAPRLQLGPSFGGKRDDHCAPCWRATRTDQRQGCRYADLPRRCRLVQKRPVAPTPKSAACVPEMTCRQYSSNCFPFSNMRSGNEIKVPTRRQTCPIRLLANPRFGLKSQRLPTPIFRPVRGSPQHCEQSYPSCNTGIPHKRFSRWTQLFSL